MKSWIVLLVLLSLLLTSSARACAPSPGEEFPCYGEKTETSVLIELVNETGSAICALRIRPEAAGIAADWEEWPNLLGEDRFESEARIGVYFDLDTTISDPVFYAVQVVLDDGRVLTLHHLDVADMSEAVIRLDEGVAYLDYTSAATGEEVSTLLDELRILAGEEMDGAGLPEDDGGPETMERGDGDS